MTKLREMRNIISIMSRKRATVKNAKKINRSIQIETKLFKKIYAYAKLKKIEIDIDEVRTKKDFKKVKDNFKARSQNNV